MLHLSVDQSEVNNLSERIKQLEGALAQASPGKEFAGEVVAAAETSTTASPSIRGGRSVNLGTPVLQIASDPTRTPSALNGPSADRLKSRLDRLSNHLGPNWFFNGMPIRSEAGRHWISTKTSQIVSLEDFCITISEPASFVDLGSTSPSGLGKLPDEFETRELLNAYLMSPFNLAFPILDEALLESTIQSAYSESAEISLSTTQLSTTACLLATISMASYLNLSQQISTAIDAHTCAAQANSLLIQAMGDISLTTLQTILLLVR